MRKISFSLEKGQNHKKIGLAIYDYEDEEELRGVINVVKEALNKRYPSADIYKQKAVRILFGEEK